MNPDFATKLANKALWAFIVILMVLLTRSYTYGFNGSSKWVYLVEILTLIALLCSFKLSDKARQIIAYCVGSVAFALLFCEFVLTLISAQPPPKDDHFREITEEEHTHLGANFDERETHQVVLDYRKKGIRAFTPVVPSLFLDAVPTIGGKVTLPLGGIKNAFTVYCNEGGYFTDYESDEHGYRNPKGLYSAPTEVVLIGDSFTQGSCVQDDIATILRQQTPAVVNLGMGGSGPLLELAIFKEIASTLKPRVMFWLFYEGNDLFDIGVEQKNSTLLRYLESGFSQNILDRQNEIDDFLKMYAESELERLQRHWSRIDLKKWWFRFPQALTLTQLRRRLGAKNLSAPKDLHFELLRRVLSIAKSDAATWGGSIYFVYLPELDRFKLKGNDRNSFGQMFSVRDNVLEVAKSLNIPAIDMAKAFGAQKDALLYFQLRRPNHYTPAGYHLVADSLSKALHK